MSSVFEALIDKLPPHFLVFVITVLIFLFIYLLGKFIAGDIKVIRDKHGKLLITTMATRSEYDRQHDLGDIKKKLVELKTDTTELKTDTTELKIENYKQSVFIAELPLEQRIISGLRYIKTGGNSDVKKYVEDLVVAHDELYKGIIVCHPELKL